MKYCIYLDTKDINTIELVNNWFAHGFFDKNDFIILFRSYILTHYQFCRHLRKYGFTYRSYRKFKNLRIPSTIKAVFYPFNTNSNPVALKQKHCKHIFIGHGDSDKQASVNSMLRMYDHIFVAGPVSIQRLLNTAIVNQQDIDNGRCHSIGLPYLGEHKLNFEPKKINELETINVLYAPTWEGSDIRHQYSSLHDNGGISLIQYLLESGKKVFFKPHPSTGIKEKKYCKYIRNIINTFSSNKEFTLVTNKCKFNLMITYQMIPSCKIISDAQFDMSHIHMTITDISSMVTYSIFHKTSTFVLYRTTESSKNINSTCLLPYVSKVEHCNINSFVNLAKLDRNLLNRYNQSIIASYQQVISSEDHNLSNKNLFHSIMFRIISN